MSRASRLLKYVLPYGLYVAVSVVLLAMTGLLTAFRLLLIQPIFDRVLRPDLPANTVRTIPLIKIPWTQYTFDLHQVIPAHFQNDWSTVAFALVACTFLKGICDYSGTYLVNHAAFGFVTDLRNDLYDSILRRTA